MAHEPTSTQARRVSILLATCNGGRFLEQQLSSLAAQDWQDIDVWASDDGSTDGTVELLRQWQARWSKGEFHTVSGPCAGFVENFRSLLSNKAVESDFVAFCDQDDLWDSDKLSSAIRELARHGQHDPALYCSRTRLVTADGRPMGLSPLFKRPPAFRNAIVQSMGGGNTMVINRAAFVALSESARRTTFVTHDWWGYILVSGIGGTIHYDPAPHVAYRQHASNLIGHNMGLREKVLRLQFLMEGQFARWISINLAALGLCEDLLTEENRMVARELRRARRLSFPVNVFVLRRIGIYRQSWQDDAVLMLAAAFGHV